MVFILVAKKELSPAFVRSGYCNRSYCEAGSLGWLEDSSPPWRLLVPLWWLHLAQDQFQTLLGVRAGTGSSVVVKKDPFNTKFQLSKVLHFSGFKSFWARGYIPNKRWPITGSQNPGPTKPYQTKPSIVSEKIYAVNGLVLEITSITYLWVFWFFGSWRLP